MSDNHNYDIIANGDYKSPLPIIPKGGGSMDWQNEYIKKLGEDVRGIQTELGAVRNSVKDEVTALRSEMHSMRAEIKGEISELRTEMRDMRTELKSEIQKSNQELKHSFDSKINSFLAELRDRNNQRHKEMLVIQQRIDTNTAGLRNEINVTRRWIMGLVIAASASFVGIAVSVGWGLFNVVNSLVK